MSMKTLKITGFVLSSIMAVIFITIGGIYLYFINEGYVLQFPLAEIDDDEADYTLVRYGPDGYYVLDDDEYIKNHRFSVFILYPSWLDNSTGDGYYYVTRNGESVFFFFFLEGKFFDGLVSSHYTKFDTLEELISYEKSKR